MSEILIHDERKKVPIINESGMYSLIKEMKENIRAFEILCRQLGIVLPDNFVNVPE